MSEKHGFSVTTFCGGDVGMFHHVGIPLAKALEIFPQESQEQLNLGKNVFVRNNRYGCYVQEPVERSVRDTLLSLLSPPRRIRGNSLPAFFRAPLLLASDSFQNILPGAFIVSGIAGEQVAPRNLKVYRGVSMR